MRPSTSVAFEPGIERGVPWGRDLFTFVTSAAGHMMRTLQKPRKNRPSKRQVNHRRFLHNMIQRKFAEIEAANHQLSSSLFSREEHISPPSSPPPPVTSDLPHRTSKAGRLPVVSLLPAAADVTFCSEETEISALKQTEFEDGCDIHPDVQVDQSDTICLTAACDSLEDRTYHQTLKEGDQAHEESRYTSLICSEKTDDTPQWGEFIPIGNIDDKNPDVVFEDNLCNWIESVREKYDVQPSRHSSVSNHPPLGDHPKATTPNMDPPTDPQLLLSPVLSPVLSPPLSPLSLDSCDFGIQMITDLVAYSPSSYGASDPADVQRLDLLNLLEAEFGDGDFGVSMETQVTVSNTSGCQVVEAVDLTGKALIDDVTFPEQQPGCFVDRLMDQRSSDRSDVEKLDCRAGQCGYGPGYGPGYGDFASQSSAANSLISSFGSREQFLLTVDPDATERDLPRSRSTDCLEFTLNQLPSSRRSHGDVPDLHTLRSTCSQQDRSCFWSESDGSLSDCTPFGGVAKSFPAPVQNPHLVLNLPLEGDWFFTDIMEGGGLTGTYQC